MGGPNVAEHSAPRAVSGYALCPLIRKTLSFTVSAWERRPLDKSRNLLLIRGPHLPQTPTSEGTYGTPSLVC